MSYLKNVDVEPSDFVTGSGNEVYEDLYSSSENNTGSVSVRALAEGIDQLLHPSLARLVSPDGSGFAALGAAARLALSAETATPYADETAGRVFKVDSQLSRTGVIGEPLVKEILEIEAHNIARGLTNWCPDVNTAEATRWYLDYQLDWIVPGSSFRPLGPIVLGRLVEITVKALGIGTVRPGIGDYSVDALRNIFTPKELLFLDGCAKHWSMPEIWSWSEVLSNLGLGLVATTDIIKKAANTIRPKLLSHRDLFARLDVGAGIFLEDVPVFGT